jgi:hypothetical protein
MRFPRKSLSALSREDKATKVTVSRHENTTSIVGLS